MYANETQKVVERDYIVANIQSWLQRTDSNVLHSMVCQWLIGADDFKIHIWKTCKTEMNILLINFTWNPPKAIQNNFERVKINSIASNFIFAWKMNVNNSSRYWKEKNRIKCNFIRFEMVFTCVRNVWCWEYYVWCLYMRMTFSCWQS